MKSDWRGGIGANVAGAKCGAVATERLEYFLMWRMGRRCVFLGEGDGVRVWCSRGLRRRGLGDDSDIRGRIHDRLEEPPPQCPVQPTKPLAISMKRAVASWFLRRSSGKLFNMKMVSRFLAKIAPWKWKD